MMYIEQRTKLSALAPRYCMLFVDPSLPQGTDRTYVADVGTIAQYLTTAGPAGKSAYDLAVANGSTLSLSDWLASLRGPKGDPGTVTQQARLPTLADGTLTWTYPTPYPAGVIPTVSVTPEGVAGSNDEITWKLDGPPTNTACKVKVRRSTPGTLLNLTVLSVQASPGAIVLHLTARMPSA